MNEHDETAITQADHDVETYVGSSSGDSQQGQNYRAGAPAYWLSNEAAGVTKPAKQHGTATTLLLTGVVAVLTFLGVRYLVPHPASEVSFEQRATGQVSKPQPVITMPATEAKCLPRNGITTPPPQLRTPKKNNVSCGYGTEVVKAVKQQLQKNPSATNFGISPYSVAIGSTVPLSCVANKNVVHCVGGTQVDLYLLL